MCIYYKHNSIDVSETNWGNPSNHRCGWGCLGFVGTNDVLNYERWAVVYHGIPSFSPSRFSISGDVIVYPWLLVVRDGSPLLISWVRPEEGHESDWLSKIWPWRLCPRQHHIAVSILNALVRLFNANLIVIVLHKNFCNPRLSPHSLAIQVVPNTGYCTDPLRSSGITFSCSML